MPAVPWAQNPDQHPRLSTWRHAPKVSLPRHLNHHSVALCLPTTLSSCGTTLLLSLVMSPLSAGPIFIATGNPTTRIGSVWPNHLLLFPVPLPRRPSVSFSSSPSPPSSHHDQALLRASQNHRRAYMHYRHRHTYRKCMYMSTADAMPSVYQHTHLCLVIRLHPSSQHGRRPTCPRSAVQEPVCETPLRCHWASLLANTYPEFPMRILFATDPRHTTPRTKKTTKATSSSTSVHANPLVLSYPVWRISSLDRLAYSRQ
jgi:hypothetical protein